MSGRIFARVLKQSVDARKDFDAFLLERRDEIHKQLESENIPANMYRLQGKIHCLEDISSVLEQLMAPEKEPQPT